MDLKKLTWLPKFETKLTWMYDYRAENANQLGNYIINLKASILHQFEPGNIAYNLEKALLI